MIISRANQASVTHINGDTRIANVVGHVKWVYAEMPSGCRGNAHKHDILTEVVFVLDGELVASDAARDAQTVNKGDVVVFEPGSVHGLSNASNCLAKAYVLKAVIASDATKHFIELVEKDWIGESSA